MDAKDQQIQALIRAKDRRIAELEALVEKLCGRIDALELQLAKARKDSSTSSKPPSSDLVKPQKKRPPGRPKKRKQGGQPGHEMQLRKPLPPERVDETVLCELSEEEILRRDLTRTDAFETFQQIELLDLPIHVTEYRLRIYVTPDGQRITADVPETRKPIFGPRMLSMIGWLKSKAHCSYSTIQEYMQDVLDVPVSRGYLAKLCTGVISNSLQPAYEELKSAVPQQSQLGSDETGLNNNGQINWIWCITAAMFTIFHIAKQRSRAVLEKLVSEEFRGFISFDYFSANTSFARNYEVKAQYCWAHLIRDMRFLLKHPDRETVQWASQLLDRTKRMFQAWHRKHEMTDKGFEQSMITHRDRFLWLVRNGPDSKEAGNLAARFAIKDYTTENHVIEQYDMSEDYFRFMFAKGVEPTNNHSEQQIRQCAIDRRITQGTRGEAGQRYHERMWTAMATCQKQQRSFFEYLHTTISSHLAGHPAPSLLNR